MRILHLAYEDPLQPGSGGGSIRAREINRRLSERHEITALVTGYPGAEPRVEDGVRWVPVGTRGTLGPMRTGTRFDRLSYFAVLGAEVARRPHDLVVEEFGAPFGPSFSPLFTDKPVVASVQWLFASHMRQKYGLPFDRVERYGLRFYDRFIAVSEWLARDILARRPGAAVETIPNGVDPLAFEAADAPPEHLMFLGRLDAGHKGGDFLMEILARVRSLRDGRTPRLVVAGDGPDRAAMERHAKRLGLREAVEFRGRVEGEEKYRLMARSHAVLMPSRHETFGMVAVEAQAAGAPLVTFDVGPLREVVGGESRARLIDPYDLDAFARQVVRLIDDPALSARLRAAGRPWARRYDWDEIAARQEESYARAVREPSSTDHRRPSPTAERGDGGPADGGVVPAARSLNASLLSPVVAASGPKDRRPRMVLVGNYGQGNVGDEAILARLLEIVGGLWAVVVPSRNPEGVKRLHGRELDRTVEMPSLAAVRELLAADVLAIGGGGIFGRGIRPLPSALPAVAIGSKLLRKKVVYLAIGAYPGTPFPVRWLLRLSALLSDVVTVRDMASLRTMNVRVLGRSSSPVLVRDPAVDLTPADREAVVRVLGEAGVSAWPPPLFVAIKATPSAELNDRMLSAVAGAVDWWCENREGHVLLLAFSGATGCGMGDELSDATLAGRLAAMTHDPERVRVVGSGLHPRIVKGAVALSAGVVGVRLHAQIFAWATGRPLLGLSFEEKSDAFLEGVGADTVPLAEVNARRIVAWMEGL